MGPVEAPRRPPLWPSHSVLLTAEWGPPKESQDSSGRCSSAGDPAKGGRWQEGRQEDRPLWRPALPCYQMGASQHASAAPTLWGILSQGGKWGSRPLANGLVQEQIQEAFQSSAGGRRSGPENSRCKGMQGCRPGAGPRGEGGRDSRADRLSVLSAASPFRKNLQARARGGGRGRTCWGHGLRRRRRGEGQRRVPCGQQLRHHPPTFSLNVPGTGQPLLLPEKRRHSFASNGYSSPRRP